MKHVNDINEFQLISSQGLGCRRAVKFRSRESLPSSSYFYIQRIYPKGKQRHLDQLDQIVCSYFSEELDENVIHVVT
ncbi:hypothetical protein Glove_140g27 [Diversispora epigaea]|uniref:Uncharacterized protein n=1 Tax=Diversispora epigaea TaxID=1348612 RepID=A0A397IV10_9GLOM|nr:hypothetical protein Glove_140g27 [Diversispora epigaea]